MANNFPPIVTVQGDNVQLGSTVLLSDLFTVLDLDPNSVIERIKFRDANTNPATGNFFNTVTGQSYASGQTFEIAYSDLWQVRYRAASVISSEAINVEAFDGEFWGGPATGFVFSVEANTDPPIVEAEDFSVVATETINLADYVSAFDPNGYPILEYAFVNRVGDVNGGTLLYNNVEMPDATWFNVPADEIDLVTYRGAQYGKVETLSVAARDEAAWSANYDIVANTTPNSFDPTADAIESEVTLGQAISVSEMFVYSDADPNTMRSFGLIDLGVASGSGFFTWNGVPQTAGSFFWVPADQIDTVFYNSGTDFSLESFGVQVFDGQRLSTIDFADVSTVDVPRITTAPVDHRVASFSETQLLSLINVTSGVSPLFYEVIDMNPDPASAKLVVNGFERAAGEIHRISASDFSLAYVRGAPEDLGIITDEFNIRVDNGNEVSTWTGINFTSDPGNGGDILDIGRWFNPSPPLELTFNFPTSPNAYLCLQGFDECTDFQAISDPDLRNGIRYALSLYEDFFNIQFTEVSSFTLADMPFALSNAVDAGAYSYGVFNPSIPGDYNFDGDIFGVIDNLPALELVNPGEPGLETWIHEIGHSVGLEHPFAEPAGQAGEPPHLPDSVENNRYTVMSYTEAFQGIFSATPQLYDVEALASRYGFNPTYRAGNTQIKFDPTFTAPQLVYDSGGIDTFNLNNHTVSAIVDLRQGQYSSVTPIPGQMERNVGIAYGTDIENARGGRGNDTLIGNQLNNSLIGNFGDDILRGNTGIDFLHGNQGRDTYEWFIGDGNDVIDERMGAGRDSLHIHLYDEYDFSGSDQLGGTTLEDNFMFLRTGDFLNNLEVRLTLDGNANDGQITVRDMGWGRNRVETLRIFDYEGSQIGPDIDMRTIFAFSNTSPTPFEITNSQSQYGYVAQPVV